MSDFLAYERIKQLHELYEGARDLCVSFGTPLENFKDADAKWKDVIDEMYKKVQGGVISKESESGVFIDVNEQIIYNALEWRKKITKQPQSDVVPSEIYPLTIVADRYGGTYSGAQYLAFNLFAGDQPDEVGSDDTDEMMFWDENGDCKKYAIGKGATPNEALQDLARILTIKQMSEFSKH
jgi:hypothetical protein